MSELIEIHQLDYKACSLTYGEGACTASSSTRPAGETVAEFNGSSSKIEVGTPYGLAGPNNWELGLKFFYDGNNGVLYSEYSAGGTFNGVKIESNSLKIKLGSSTTGVAINTPLLNTAIDLKIEQVSRIANIATIEVTLNSTTTSLTVTYSATTLTGSSIGYGPFFGASYYSGEIYDFYIKDQNGVLVRDLPLLNNADDLTGNTTPVATDVFTLTCPSITRDVAEFNGSSSKIEYGLKNNFGCYIPFQTNTYIFECIFFDLPTVGQHQIYDSTGTHFYFAGGSGALSLIVEGYSCGSFVVTSEIQQQAGFKLIMVTDGASASYEAFINGSSIGTLTRNPGYPPTTATAAKLGEYRNVGINANFKMADWKTYRNGVLETDIPLIDSVTDLTGNSTPTATDVSFISQSLSGVDPSDPTQCALIENPDGKCFNTYATCQDIANYSQTSKTLTFAKKQAAALPLQTLQRFEGDGAEFNGSNSQIGLSPVGLNSANNQWFVEMEINQHSHINIGDGDGLYIEHTNFSSGLGIFLKKYDANTSYAFILSSSGNSSSFNHTVNTLNRISLNTSTKIKIVCTSTVSSSHNLELYIDDVLSGSGTVFAVSQVPLYAFIGTAKNSSLNGRNFDGNIKNFKAGLTSVIRNLPLISDVTDTTGNSSPVAYNMTFGTTTINYKAALPHIPLLDSSSTKSGELNIGARRSVSGPLGKYSSASVTMTDEAYSDNLTDPYISERTYNPLERGTFWSKFLAQNPYHEGDTYRIYNGEAGQDLASMPFKQFIVDRITAPNSGGNVSIKLVDQFRKLDPAKAVFLNLGVNKLKGDITANDAAINTTYVSGEVNDINSLQPYLKIGSEIIGIGAQTTDGVTIGFSGCTRGMFGTTAQNHSSDTLIQPCHYFYPSTVLPEADRGLYYYLQTLFNAAGISDSFLDLTGWQDEISARLSLFNNVKRLVTKAGTTVNKLLGELQRDCGFFMWFDETDKKIKLKAVRPEGAEFTLFEHKHLIAGKTSHSVESEDRITDVWVSHTIRNQVEDLTDLDNYKDNFVLIGDGSNPYKYGQRSLYEFRSPWIQNQDQARLTTERVLRRYDDSIKFINFSLDHTFNVRMGQVFKLKYSAFTDASGAPLDLFWQVIGLDRVDNEIKIKAQEFYFGFGFVVYGDSSIPNYDQASEEQQNKYGFYNISKWG